MRIDIALTTMKQITSNLVNERNDFVEVVGVSQIFVLTSMSRAHILDLAYFLQTLQRHLLVRNEWPEIFERIFRFLKPPQLLIITIVARIRGHPRIQTHIHYEELYKWIGFLHTSDFPPTDELPRFLIH
jgi:hypothetical protein